MLKGSRHCYHGLISNGQGPALVDSCKSEIFTGSSRNNNMYERQSRTLWYYEGVDFLWPSNISLDYIFTR